MAVLSHEVHARTREGAEARWGCWNRPRRRDPVLMKDGHLATSPDGLETVQRWRLIDDFGSLECRNDVSLTDHKCEGCEHRGSGERYNTMVRERGQA